MHSMLSPSDRLARLRSLLSTHRLAAYLVPSEDAHQSEYISPCDARRAFISGFTGSAGTAIVTADGEAALWTDGRYFGQAERQLDKAAGWQLMREGVPGTPKRDEWLRSVHAPLHAELKLKDGEAVGVDPRLISFEAASRLKEQLKKDGRQLELRPVKENLVDMVWGDERPERVLNPVKCLPLKYSGKLVTDKLTWLKHRITEQLDCSGLLVTALDEIAWLLNLRGSDIPFNPVFFSHCLVTRERVELFIDRKERLELEEGGGWEQEPKVRLSEYARIFERVSEVAKEPGRLWVSSSCNWALVEAAGGADRVLAKSSPIELEKAIKNATEIEGFRQCHIRDAAALCNYFAWLEAELAKGGVISEVDGANQLEQYRRRFYECVGLSFDTISGVGPNGAIIHYKPESETATTITTDQLYLCDSGGQYLDGTTDVTRTLHFGTPSEHERDCFTRVLKGVIALATAVFPHGTKGFQLDVLARQFLWQVGLDYRHGTGHGVGHYLNVHEGPQSISFRASNNEESGLRPGMTVTDEPGYYEDGRFGIRIENVLITKHVNTPFRFGDQEFLGFETLTLCPMQRKMIKVELLTTIERDWINAYHAECRVKVAPLLEGQPGLKWLLSETEPL